MKTIKITLPNPCDAEYEIVQAIYSMGELYVSDESREEQSICLTIPYTKIEQLLFVILSVICHSGSSHYNFSIQ